jgi:tagaturonate epimerase
VDPDLFRKLLDLSIERYPLDRESYHVSAVLERVPNPASLADADLPGLLDQFDARQVLHVTFGSMLARYGSDLRRVLSQHEEEYDQDLERHFEKHLELLILD